MAVHPFYRYVAVGDSSTEGWDDPDGRGGLRGWADRLAERVAAAQDGPLLYANLGVRGLRTREILERQLEPALAMRPDLATLFSGTNDVLARRFDPASLAADVERMQRALIGAGATLLTFTLPDLTPVMPSARWLRGRVETLNDRLRRVARTTGAILVDFAAHPVASDPRLWSDDRIHANAAGHARMAQALAHALGLPGADGSWAEPLPSQEPLGRARALSAELAWFRRHVLPWVVRGLSGGEARGRKPKRPELLPFELDVLSPRHPAGTASPRPKRH